MDETKSEHSENDIENHQKPEIPAVTPQRQLPISSVNDFLRQSSEIQAEIKQISRLCHKISPNIKQKISEFSEDEEAEQADWKDLNEQLVSIGIPEIQIYTSGELEELPDLASVVVSIQALIQRCHSLQKATEEPKVQHKKRKVNDLARNHSVHRYESLIKDLRDFQDSTVELLGLNDPTEVPSAIEKLQEVMHTLPKIEEFMNSICSEVNMYTHSSKPEDILLSVRNWRKGSMKYSKIRDAIGADGKLAFERAKAINYFCRLFADDQDNPREVVEHIYYFVLEIKNFLAIVRKNYKMSPDASVKSVLERLTFAISRDLS